MIYRWEFTTLEVYLAYEGEVDVVFSFPWRLNASEGGFHASDYAQLEVGFSAGEPFVPFADLTESDIESWCIAALPVDEIKAGLRAQIAAQQNPTTEVMDLPWAPNGP